MAEINAQLNYLHIAPRKVRLLASMLKGMDVTRAELELRHITKRSAAPLLKLLRSAVSNAEHNVHARGGVFYIRDMRVNAGPMVKRMRPRAFGRAAPIRRRMSHVSLVLGVREEQTPTYLPDSTKNY